MDGRRIYRWVWCQPGPVKLFTKKFLVLMVGVCLVISFLSFTSDSISLEASRENAEELGVIERQHARRKILEAGCRATRSSKTQKTIDDLISNRKYDLGHIIVNDEYELLYCYVPKVSCTQWKKVFAVLGGTLPSDIEIEKIPGGDAHKLKRHQILGRMTPGEIRQRLETYRAFLFVRHPFYRLVSGYRNKLEGRGSDERFPQMYAKDMQWRRDLGSKQSGADANATAQGPVTFEQFVRWVSEPVPPQYRYRGKVYSKGAYNEHWDTASNLCHPCTINYTLIGHQETLLPDAHYVLQVANITEVTFPSGFQKNSDPHHTSQVAPDMLAQLRPQVLFNAVFRYFEDFLLFGFSPNSVFEGRNKTVSQSVLNMFVNISKSVL